MSEIEIIEKLEKRKKSLSYKRKYSKWMFRISAMAVIAVCVAVSWWLIASRQTPTSALPENTPLPVQPSAPVQPPAPVEPPVTVQPPAAVDLPAGDIINHLITKDGKKVAYLTFDDGPSVNTEKFLEILNNYGIKATFFVTGETAEKYPHLIQKIHADGHSIGNHSYSHVYDNIYAGPEQFSEEVTGAQNVLANILGAENVMPLFRFPGGSFGEKKKPYLSVIENMGYSYVDWNCLNGDAEGGKFTPEMSVNAIKEHSEGKEDVVILMHDTVKKDVTLQTLPTIIEYLISQGFAFDRIVVN